MAEKIKMEINKQLLVENFLLSKSESVKIY